MVSLAGQYGIQARANRLANHRLHAAMAALPDAEFHAPRVSFFPSLAATLNHILAVDLYYIGALHGDAGLVRVYRDFAPASSLGELEARQRGLAQRVFDQQRERGRRGVRAGRRTGPRGRRDQRPDTSASAACSASLAARTRKPSSPRSSSSAQG